MTANGLLPSEFVRQAHGNNSVMFVMMYFGPMNLYDLEYEAVDDLNPLLEPRAYH
jgi:hypothetical protein